MGQIFKISRISSSSSYISVNENSSTRAVKSSNLLFSSLILKIGLCTSEFVNSTIHLVSKLMLIDGLNEKFSYGWVGLNSNLSSSLL